MPYMKVQFKKKKIKFFLFATFIKPHIMYKTFNPYL